MAGLTGYLSRHKLRVMLSLGFNALSVSFPCESAGDSGVSCLTKSPHKTLLLVPPAVSFCWLKGLGRSEQRTKDSGAGRTDQNLQQIYCFGAEVGVQQSEAEEQKAEGSEEYAEN